jgi:hypothetical protein
MLGDFLDPKFKFECDLVFISGTFNFKIEDWDNIFKESSIKFILTEIIFTDKEKKQHDKSKEYPLIKVDLKTNEYNFFIVNNIIDEKFIKYFLKSYYRKEIEDIDLLNKDIHISILDDNVNKFEYNINNDYIHISETNYFRKSDIITED